MSPKILDAMIQNKNGIVMSYAVLIHNNRVIIKDNTVIN